MMKIAFEDKSKLFLIDSNEIRYISCDLRNSENPQDSTRIKQDYHLIIWLKDKKEPTHMIKDSKKKNYNKLKKALFDCESTIILKHE